MKNIEELIQELGIDISDPGIEPIDEPIEVLVYEAE